MRNDVKNVIIAVLNDDEAMSGGIFTKRDYYMNKYDLTDDEMTAIEIGVHHLVHVKDEYFRNQLLK